MVKYFMEYFKHYLLGQHFRVYSDHEGLKWLFSLKEPKHRIARWIEVFLNLILRLSINLAKSTEMQMPYPDVQTLGTAPVFQKRKMNYHASHVRNA